MEVSTIYVKRFYTTELSNQRNLTNTYLNSVSALASVMYKLGWLGAPISDEWFYLTYGSSIERKCPEKDRYHLSCLVNYLDNVCVDKMGNRAHRVKSDPNWFKLNVSGAKLSELRRNDRDYHVEDVVIFQEYVRCIDGERNDVSYYTGNVFAAQINWLTTSNEWLKEGYCSFGLTHLHAFLMPVNVV